MLCDELSSSAHVSKVKFLPLPGWRQRLPSGIIESCCLGAMTHVHKALSEVFVALLLIPAIIVADPNAVGSRLIKIFKNMDPEARMRALYSVMQSIENKLGGGEGVEGLYGSINKGGMTKIIRAMQSKCGLDGSSRLVDIGAGLGRPLVHALVEPGIQSALGVEIDRIKCDKAVAFLRQTANELQRRGVCKESLSVPDINCSSIEQIKTLDPCTHAYSFWEGVPFDGKMAFGSLFAASRTLRSVTVVQRAMRGQDPAEAMEELGFGDLVLVDSFSVSMSGSGRSFTAYLFNKAGHPTHLPAALPVEAALAESVATPHRSHEAHPPCASVDSAPSSVLSAVTTASAAAAAAGLGEEPLECQGPADAPTAQQQQQVPALGRGSRQAVRSRKAAEAAAAAAAAAAGAAKQGSRGGCPRRQRAAAAAECSAAEQAPAQPEAAAAGAASSTTFAEGKRGAPGAGCSAPAASPRKVVSPQQRRGVQKKLSPTKRVTRSLLQDAHIRRPREAAAAAGRKVQAKAKAPPAAIPQEGAPPQELLLPNPPARRGLLA